MTIDESIRDKINRVLSSEIVEEVECDQLPITIRIGDQWHLCSIIAYCYICGRETLHVVYRKDDNLYIICSVCERRYGFGDHIFWFVKTYCSKCQRVTVHGIYENFDENLYIKCLGCGRYTYIGNL